MSNWFIYLFVKTLGTFNDPEAHVSAVAKIFEKGAPRQAALLHALCHTERELLGFVDARQAVVEAQTFTASDVVDLPAGAYKLCTDTHAVAYIKIDEQRGYVFDPNVGLLRCTSAKDAHAYFKKLPSSKKFTFWLMHPLHDTAQTHVSDDAARAG